MTAAAIYSFVAHGHKTLIDMNSLFNLRIPAPDDLFARIKWVKMLTVSQQLRQPIWMSLNLDQLIVDISVDLRMLTGSFRYNYLSSNFPKCPNQISATKFHICAEFARTNSDFQQQQTNHKKNGIRWASRVRHVLPSPVFVCWCTQHFCIWMMCATKFS